MNTPNAQHTEEKSVCMCLQLFFKFIISEYFFYELVNKSGNYKKNNKKLNG